RQLRREAPQTNQVGFAPGAVYSPPKPPAPPPSAPKLSDTTRCLRWVNDYCQLSALELKYLRLGGAFDPASLQWKIQNRGALQSMLQSAEIGARRGMAMAEKVGVPAAMLGLIDENASALAASSDDEDRLEALRQYWRCALLGNLAWQLGSPAAAVKPPEPKPEEQPAAEPAEKAPEQQAPPAPKPKARDQEKPKEPEAVPALPVSPEELDRDQQMQDQTDSGE
ncbi:MAG: hypothetical protein JO317_07120, partial [Verrucomicrobiae bacterium]|nr:hypothetical protein [Verrucomicrobiae bacterium]